MSEYCKNCEALLQENEELKEKMQIINDARITLLNIQDGMCSDLVDFKAKNKLLKEQLLAEREKVKELEEQLELNTANAVVVDYATRLHEYKQALEPFEDEYFKGLDTKQIAELAKKSIRLTTENRKLECVLEEIEGIVKNYCKDCGDYEDCNWEKEGCYYSLIPNLKDIISKAKGEENEW